MFTWSRTRWGVLALRPNATRFVRAGFLRPTYRSVKQLSSDAAAPLRLLTLLSASKLIPKPLLSPDAPVSAVVQKEGGRGYFKTHEFSLIGSPVQPSNLGGKITTGKEALLSSPQGRSSMISLPPARSPWETLHHRTSWKSGLLIFTFIILSPGVYMRPAHPGTIRE